MRKKLLFSNKAIRLAGKLRLEHSINCSGRLLNLSNIPVLKEAHYIVKDYDLDGDAPKQFIKIYQYKNGSLLRRKSSKSWMPYIAKTAEKWYPHESVIEYLMNRIGEELGLHMNGIKLLVINGQIRFLSKYFICKNEKLIHGAEICGEYLEDLSFAMEIANHKTNSRALFTFEFMKDAIRTVFPDCFEKLLEELVKMLTFDALAGNNDRHFYNWGVIDTKRKSCKLPSFAPIYDSARGLLWNWSDANIISTYQTLNQGNAKLKRYIEHASPRISIEENTQANHFELIDFLKRYNNDYRIIIDDLASEDNEAKVLSMIEKEFSPFFIKERTALIALNLKERFKKIRSL